MTDIIVTLSILTHRKIKVKKKFLWFNITTKIDEKYLYWIEYRIDENRYYYGEIKPEFNSITGLSEIKENYIHTKNAFEKSIEIIEDIYNRVSFLHKDWTCKIDNRVGDLEKFQYVKIDKIREAKHS